jgi:hypothetical protein
MIPVFICQIGTMQHKGIEIFYIFLPGNLNFPGTDLYCSMPLDQEKGFIVL